jgi:hypothetical protein
MIERRSVQELIEEDGLPEDLVIARLELFSVLGV